MIRCDLRSLLLLSTLLAFVAGPTPDADANRVRAKAAKTKNQKAKAKQRASKNAYLGKKRAKGVQMTQAGKSAKMQNSTFSAAVTKGNWRALMVNLPNSKQGPSKVLKLKSLTGMQRQWLTKNWSTVGTSGPPQESYRIDFRGLTGPQRQSFAVGAFRGYEKSALTQEAWKRAGTAKSADASPNNISFRTPTGSVRYTNTPGGTFRQTIKNGKTETHGVDRQGNIYLLE